MIDSMLLLSVKKILKLSGSRSRVFAGAALGAISTCLLFVLDIPIFLKYAFFHCIINVLMIFVGLNVTKAIQIFHALIMLYIVSVMVGGIMYIFRPYMRNISLFYGVMVITYLIMNIMLKIIIRFRSQQKYICRVSVFTSEGIFELQALEDTGNVLRDPVSDEPVSVIDIETAEQILGISKEKYDRGMFSMELFEQEKFRFITYKTIAGVNVMPIVRVEKMIIHLQSEHLVISPLLGICAEPVSERQNYQMILNSDILGGAKYVSKTSNHTESEV